MHTWRRTITVLGSLAASAAAFSLGGGVNSSEPLPRDDSVPLPLDDFDLSESAVRPLIERYEADRGNVQRFHDIPMSSRGAARKRELFQGWLKTLERVDFDALNADGRVDCVLFQNQLDYELRTLEIDVEKDKAARPLIPFFEVVVELEEGRRRLEPVDPQQAANRVARLVTAIASARQAVEAALDGKEPKDGALPRKASVAKRAADRADGLLGILKRWYRFYEGYDPVFTWWVKEPFQRASKDLEAYGKFLRERLLGVKPEDKDAIVGEPIGREALLSDLAHELVPNSPEELIEIANRELVWCDAEMERASRELGFGGDWRRAQDHVSGLHVAPGKQPELIRDLAREAVSFLEERALLTIPALCKETWRMEMMTPELQKVNPYFTGGEVISVSFPTDDMVHEDKLMSLRGNNVHFSRATVQHELIPGHHLQSFMQVRYRKYRQIFETPFWLEGWALYWEMRLWDLGFPKSAEDRVGMLFWRKHRCVRIIFSLKAHLEQMTPAEAIELLVERVGHERRNAAAEVRRSFGGGYSPLYQCAYMLGGLQIRALHRELVETKKMTEREFHDAVLKQNAIPIELIRAALTGEKLGRGFRSRWRF